jgi:hypothetical protein
MIMIPVSLNPFIFLSIIGLAERGDKPQASLQEDSQATDTLIASLT